MVEAGITRDELDRRRGPPAARHDQRGSVSVLAAAVMLMVVVMALATADVARALAAASRAQAAADAAALAAAQQIVEPASGESPESVAARFADENGAELVSCDCSAGGQEAVATVRVEISGLLLLRSGRSTTATARAVIDLSGAG
ncbi:MAG TPA: Rv3654c family TadE-like protein [Actinomycetota bacterium]|nr:Rv3654c family TadE-like protein [Actinomycetota bacterium]